jgi:hypothetical protein
MVGSAALTHALNCLGPCRPTPTRSFIDPSADTLDAETPSNTRKIAAPTKEDKKCAQTRVVAGKIGS